MNGEGELFVLSPPVLGLHEGTAFGTIPEGYSSEELNVTSFDGILHRARVGRRPGLGKFVASQINGSNPVQAMTKVVRSIVPAGADGPATTATSTPGSVGSAMPPDWVKMKFVGHSGTNFPVSNEDTGGTTVCAVETVGGAARIVLRGINNSSLVSQFQCRNSITAAIHATPLARIDGSTTAGDCNMIGPMIRVKTDLSEGIVARLVRNSSNTSVVLRVSKFVQDGSGAPTYTTLYTSSAFTLSGGATLSEFTIKLEDVNTTTIRVTYTWTAESHSFTADIPTTDFTDSSHRRAGVMHGIVGAGDSLTTEARYINSVIVIRDGEPSTSVSASVIGTTGNPVGTERYYIPTSVTGVRCDGAGVTSSQNGPFESASNQAFPVVDDSNNIITHDASAIGPKFMALTSATAARLAMSVTLGDQVTFTVVTPWSVVFRVSDAFDDYIEFRLTVTRSTTHDQISITAASLNRVVNGVSTVVDSSVHPGVTTGGTAAIVIRNDDSIVFEETGEDGQSTFRVYAHGLLLFSYTIAASAVQSSSYPALYGSDGSSHRRCGAGIAAASASTEMSALRWIASGLLPEGGDAPDDTSTIEAALVTVAGGNVYRIVEGVVNSVAGGSAALNDTPGLVVLQPAYSRVFAIDGNVKKVYNLNTDTVGDWTPTAGSLPSNPRLMCLYRGRIVLSGTSSDPHNWFMSAAGDPFDWDYSPSTPTAIQAVAGNNSEAGLVGDIITALIPHSDDAMLFGCDSSIWQMTNDPAAGGAIDLVSDDVGIVFGSAWTKDPEGTVYFQGIDGIYRLIIGGKPECITRNRLDKRFDNIDFRTARAMLSWSYLHRGLIVQIALPNINGSASPNTAFFWDRRTDAWHPWRFPTSMGPSCMYAFDGVDADDQAMLFGCKDGYIRKLDELLTSDDGTSIQSYVRFAPVQLGLNWNEGVLVETVAVMGLGSSAVTLAAYAEQTPQDAVESATPRWTRTLEAGARTNSIRLRARGNSLCLRLSYTGTGRWAMEQIMVRVNPGGRVKRRAR